MKIFQNFHLLVIIMLLSFASCNVKKSDETAILPQTDISEFTGQWTIDISGNRVGWLEVRQEDGYIDGELLWMGGSVSPVTHMYMFDNLLIVGRNTRKVVRKKDADGIELRSQIIPSWLEIKKEGDNISGYHLSPKNNGIGIDSISFIGTKLPDVPTAPDLSNIKYGDPIELFNGKDLSGWELIEKNKSNGWSVENGILINNPVSAEGTNPAKYGNIKTVQEFKDLNLKLEVNVPEGSNSGVYLCGRYEIQVMDSYGRKLDSHNMGALYSRATPLVSAEKPAGSWQTLDVTLCDRHVTVILNGIKIIDNHPVYGPTGGALTSDVFAPGPIYLQGDHGKVSYRNIVLKQIIK